MLTDEQTAAVEAGTLRLPPLRKKQPTHDRPPVTPSTPRKSGTTQSKAMVCRREAGHPKQLSLLGVGT